MPGIFWLSPGDRCAGQALRGSQPLQDHTLGWGPTLQGDLPTERKMLYLEKYH